MVGLAISVFVRKQGSRANRMEASFSPREESIIYGLLAEATTDIILKADREGFILHASPAIEQLGFSLQSMLIGPHIVDLVHPAYAVTIGTAHDAAMAGHHGSHWTEFPIRRPTHGDDSREQWFEIQLRPLTNDSGLVCGSLGIMRSIEARKSLEEELFTAAMTDPLTGLTNRKAFISMLQHLVAGHSAGCLALFDIDRFKAINMRYGQSAGDRVLVAFSELLRALMRPQDIISRIGNESLAVLLPDTTPDQAEIVCQHAMTALSEINRGISTKSLSITASAGVGQIAGSVDGTMQRTELALFFAKAKGLGHLEMDNSARFPRPRNQVRNHPQNTTLGGRLQSAQ